MSTYRRRLVVQDPKQIMLSDVPFQTGQEVEITLRSVAQPKVERKNDLRALLKKTQSLPSEFKPSQKRIFLLRLKPIGIFRISQLLIAEYYPIVTHDLM